MNKKQNPLQIRVGDTVEIDFGSHDQPSFLADVTEVTDRTTMGEDACITYIRHDGAPSRIEGAPLLSSVSHIVRVVNRIDYVVKHERPANIFRDMAEQEHQRAKQSGQNSCGYEKFGGVCTGRIDNLVIRILGLAHDELTRPYDPERFHTLWAKAGYPGKVALKCQNGMEEYLAGMYISVRHKSFKCFVLANRHRILCTIKDMEQMGRDELAAWDDAYEECATRHHSFPEDIDDLEETYNDHFVDNY